MAKTEYNTISQEYKTSKLLGFRKYIEEYTLFRLIGDLKGKSVLDLACGEGIYTRKIKLAGAEKAHGVDISEEMILLAIMEEKRRPIGCQYIVEDVSQLRTLAKFDVVVGSYLLNYSQNVEELKLFARAIYQNMKPGGSFVGINNNPMDLTNSNHTFRKYGFTKQTPDGQKDGDRVVWTFYNPDNSSFTLDNYFLSPQTHKDIFKEVGFSSFEWEKCMLSPKADHKDEKDYWKEFMQAEPIIAMHAVK